MAATVFLALVLPRPADGVVEEPSSPRVVVAADSRLVTQPVADGLVRVLADDAGHRFDRGRVREVEVGPDGTIWLAVGRRVLALGQPGAIEPRAPGWRAFPRQLAILPSGRPWAVEDGGSVIVLGDEGWAVVDSPPGEPAPPAVELDEAALALLRAAGHVHQPTVLATAAGPEADGWLLVDASEHPDVRPARYLLLRRDGTDWTLFGSTEGMPREVERAWSLPALLAPASLVVDPAGRAWFSVDRLGLFVLDGERVRQLRAPGLGLGALDLAIGPDGAVWIVSARGGLLRLGPEAGTAG